MPHDVFISHSARDKPYADAVCAKLESQNIRCWIAPRDIRPGMDWGAAIIEAIDNARVMLLVFSSHANGSPQIKREVERAVNKELVVVPVRVEDVKPTGNLEYFLGTPHWLDAITPPFEHHLDRIADSTKFWLERIKNDSTTPEAAGARQALISQDQPRVAPLPDAITRERTRPKWIAPTIAASAILLVAALGYFGTQYFDAQQRLVRQRIAEQAVVGRTFRDCGDCPQMIMVPAGGFTMGSPASEVGRVDWEGPQHHVTIGYSFAVGRYLVTRDEYARFASETGAISDWQDPGYSQTGKDPVVNVNWNEAKAYVAWLSKKTGKRYRLLSESEYEYVERAGTTTAYWWGDSEAGLCRYANGGQCNHEGTVPVGSYPANAFGLYDIAGNVWEWTEDCWNFSYTGAPNDGTARTSATCGQRVMRGGSCVNLARDLRSANRVRFDAGARYANLSGFRVARTL
jgi:formylglycine-generating enzyme required for sulfatase activity